MALVAATISACSAARTGSGHTADPPARRAHVGAAGSTAATDRATATPSAATKPPAPPAKPVHVSLFQGDGQTYGVGFAIIATFDRAPTNSHAFTHAATVTINGTPAHGAWFWQKSEIPGYQLNRPGCGGGSEATGEWFSASTEEVPERVA